MYTLWKSINIVQWILYLLQCLIIIFFLIVFFLVLSTALPSSVFCAMEDAISKITVCCASPCYLFATKPSKHLANTLPPDSYCFCFVSNYKEATARKAPRLQCLELRDVYVTHFNIKTTEIVSIRCNCEFEEKKGLTVQL